jgi:hypothetical protein
VCEHGQHECKTVYRSVEEEGRNQSKEELIKMRGISMKLALDETRDELELIIIIAWLPLPVNAVPIAASDLPITPSPANNKAHLTINPNSHNVSPISFPPAQSSNPLRLQIHPPLAPGQCLPPPVMPCRARHQGSELLTKLLFQRSQGHWLDARYREPEHS